MINNKVTNSDIQEVFPPILYGDLSLHLPHLFQREEAAAICQDAPCSPLPRSGKRLGK